MLVPAHPTARTKSAPVWSLPDEIKDRHHARSHSPQGRIGVVSRSGTLTYEAVAPAMRNRSGQSSAVGIGGDPAQPTSTSKHIDVMKAFNDDPDTGAVIMIR